MTDRPTIIMFSVNFDPWTSGAERFVQEVVERLSARYHFVLFTARHSRSVPRRETRDGYEIRRLGLGTRFDKWLFVLLAPFSALTVKTRIAHAVMESYAGIALWIYGLLRPRVRRVLTLQSGDLDAPEKQARIPGWLWKKIHTDPHAVTAISRFLADRAVLLRASADTVTVIPNGVDLGRISARDDRWCVPGRIVCIARLSWEKGLTHVLRAVEIVRRDVPDAHLVLVGDGPRRPELEAEARRLGLFGAVTFRGSLPHDEALDVLRTAHVFVCPSLAEGLGIVFIEAQAVGVPVIGTSVGGIPDVIEDGVTGFLVPPSDAPAIARAIRRVFDDPSRGASFVAAARARLDRFDWNRIAASVGTLYERLLTSSYVLIAASIYPPDGGGPATIAHAFVEEWRSGGRMADVVVRRRRPFASYCRELWRVSRHADVVFAQDASPTAVIAALLAHLRRLPFVVRLGGDLLWERAATRGATRQGISGYYASGEWRQGNFRYRAMLWFVLRAASRVVFPNDWLPRLYASIGYFDRRKEVIVLNPAPRILSIGADDPVRQFLIVARLVPLKNLERTLDACRAAHVQDATIGVKLVGDGPLASAVCDWQERHGAAWLTLVSRLSREELLVEMRRSLAVVLLSWSEVSPNLVLESLAVGTPAVVTRENGNRALFEGFALQIDPADDQAIVRALVELAGEDGQRQWRERVRTFRWPQTVGTMTDQYRGLFHDLCAF